MFQSHENQMVIDLDRPQVAERHTRVDAVRTSVSAIFHPESSNIESSRFGLKFSYRGGTYLVQGTYHMSVLSYLTDDQISRVVNFISIDSIRTYINGGYIPSRLTKNEDVALTRATHKAVKDPYINPFITAVHTRNSFV